MTKKKELTLFQKIAGTGIFVPSMAVTWLVSGAITFCIQSAVFVVVYPFSPSTFRRLNELIVVWWWLIILWAMEWWSQMEVIVSSSTGDFDKGETAIILGNHAGDVDWMLGWYLASKVGLLQGCKAYMKRISLYVLPILGWSWYLTDYVGLSRDWNKDQRTLKKTFSALKTYPNKFWICLFAEGTRKSPERIAESQKWCKANNKPELQHVLWPRTKGFAATVLALDDRIEVVYDMTMSPDPELPPSFMGMLCARPMRCYLNVKAIHDIPKTEEGLKKLCEQIFIDKDKDLEYIKKNIMFPYPVITKNLERRWLSRVCMYFWTTLIQGTIAYLLLTSDSATVRYSIILLHVFLGAGLLGIMQYGAAQRSKAKTS